MRGELEGKREDEREGERGDDGCRCLGAERRAEQLGAEIASARSRALQAEEDRRALAERHARLEEAAVGMEKSVQSVRAEEKGRREEMMLSLRQEARMRSCALEDEVRALEATVADLSHQLSRARSEQSKQARREGGMMVGMGALSAMMCEASAPIGSLIASDAATRAARMEGTRAMDELAARLGEHTPRPAAALKL